MRYARRPLRTLQLGAILAIIASASSIRSEWLFERDGVCAANFAKCPQAGLPPNFCCAKGASCSLLAGGTTVLCCPDGSDCGTIKAISCTISLQDATANPEAGVKTTALDKELPTCGKGCCPFGYHCDGGGDNCVKDDDQTKKPGETTSPSSSSSSSPSSSSSSSSSIAPSSSSSTSPSPSASSPSSSSSAISSRPPGPTATAQSSTTTLETQVHPTSSSTTAVAAGGGQETAIPSTETPTTSAAQTLNTAAIIGGVVGGIAVILLIAGAFWLVRHKRKKAEEERRRRDSVLSFGNISAPMPHEKFQSQRLDFLAKAHSSSVATSPTHAQERFSSSPYSPYGGYGFRPESAISEMSDLPHSQHASPRTYHPSAEIGALRNLTDRYSGSSAMTGSSRGSDPFMTRSERQHSGGSESINIFADPSTVGTPPLDMRERRDTTWTDFQHQVDQQVPDMPVRRR
ncbi:hypothetical protein F5Y17DRAFT_76883 [Xylariaceae sp. FL0594]|nr:hypothetical protein F5Y17DRAFT_76883 [Xylariaceae sp. FL0594]